MTRGVCMDRIMIRITKLEWTHEKSVNDIKLKKRTGLWICFDSASTLGVLDYSLLIVIARLDESSGSEQPSSIYVANRPDHESNFFINAFWWMLSYQFIVAREVLLQGMKCLSKVHTDHRLLVWLSRKIKIRTAFVSRPRSPQQKQEKHLQSHLPLSYNIAPTLNIALSLRPTEI
jgi:hypothetical protein